MLSGGHARGRARGALIPFCSYPMEVKPSAIRVTDYEYYRKVKALSQQVTELWTDSVDRTYGKSPVPALDEAMATGLLRDERETLNRLSQSLQRVTLTMEEFMVPAQYTAWYACTTSDERAELLRRIGERIITKAPALFTGKK